MCREQHNAIMSIAWNGALHIFNEIRRIKRIMHNALINETCLHCALIFIEAYVIYLEALHF